MTKSRSVPLPICVIPLMDVDDLAVLCRDVEGQERIYTYIEAGNYLLNSKAIDNFIAKAA